MPPVRSQSLECYSEVVFFLFACFYLFIVLRQGSVVQFGLKFVARLTLNPTILLPLPVRTTVEGWHTPGSGAMLFTLIFR